MNIEEAAEFREISKRVNIGHATRAEIERAREILASSPDQLERFNARVAAKALAGKASDRTAAKRKAAQRARESAFEIGTVGDPELRGSCRFDLPLFGISYCANLIKHAPSETMVRTLILPIQNAILFGGMNQLQFPRGTGKTTWIKIAMIWAVLYGHKRFIVTIAATRAMAESINDQILLTLEGSAQLARDFPAVVAPIVALAGNWRKASTQQYEGRPTRIANSKGYIILPTIYKTGTDEPVEVAAGAIIYTAGIHGAIRGLAREKLRPDMLLFDDPQTREEAESATSSDKLERLIEGDALGNFGHEDIRSCLMAITPIRPGDIASRFSDRRLHAAWGSSKQSYIISRPPEFDELFPAFREAYAEDVAAQKAANLRGEPLTGESAWAISTQFYINHKAAFAATEVLDPLNFNRFEKDAIHHILNVRASYRDLAIFEAELQMDVSSELEGAALDPDEVAGRTNGTPRNVMPPGTFDCTAFIDVNTARGAGLRWGVVAFGPNRVAAVINYGSFPADGSALVPPNTDPATKKDLIKRGIRSVVRHIVQLPIRHGNGARVFPSAMGIDAGYAADAVHEVVAEIAGTVNLHGMDLYATLGRAWSQYKNFKKAEEREIISKDHVYSGVSLKRRNGKLFARKYLGMHSDYWREVAQKAFWSQPLEAGSVSLFGDSPSPHRDFANEVTYEKLIRTYREDKKPFRQAWEWANDNPGHNHFMDVLYGAFAIAAWKDLYRAAAQLPPSVTAPRVAGKKAEWLDESSRAAIAAAKKPRATVKRPSRFRTRFVKR